VCASGGSLVLGGSLLVALVVLGYVYFIMERGNQTSEQIWMGSCSQVQGNM